MMGLSVLGFGRFRVLALGLRVLDLGAWNEVSAFGVDDLWFGA